MPVLRNAAPILKAQADMIRAAADLVESGSGVVRVDIDPNSRYAMTPDGRHAEAVFTTWSIHIEIEDRKE